MADKFYKIGEVAELLNLKTHVLRFWETEFAQLEPLRTDSGQRIYTEEHVDMLRRIRQLLHEQGMTIEGAKRVLAGEESAIEQGSQGLETDFCAKIQSELAAICHLLRQGTGS